MKRIVIVGGGSAGWLTAGIIAAEYQQNGSPSIHVTLVESPDVKTIGVGEGTWPSMRNTLKQIGLGESEFITHCNASFKQGSKFVGWVNGHTNNFYYHPFTLPQGSSERNMLTAWQSLNQDGVSFASALGIQAAMCDLGRAPKLITTPEYAGVCNYGYHLDAGLFGDLLHRHCVEKLGVIHVKDHVTQINAADNGDIRSLSTQTSGDLEAELFIDCSGLTSLLLGQHYNIEFIDKIEHSSNDSALAMQVPYEHEDSLIASPTISTAQSAGWIWDIGLSSRRGVGYVYSSAHISDDRAEDELKAYISAGVGVKKAAQHTPRKLTIRPGHRKLFWYKNCVAVGMSAGFIEPLEASALALVELSANTIRDEMPMTREAMDVVAERFNQKFLYHWERIIDFLKLHYALTKRTDTDYWRDAARPESLSDNLKNLLCVWRNRPPQINDLMHIEEIFPSASYLYVLYGMGFKSELNKVEKKSDNIALGLRDIKENIEKASKYAALLPTNRDLIKQVYKFGFKMI
jgi:tryptophan 7-halogenase